VGICAVSKKHFGHVVFAGGRAIPKRHAPCEDDIVLVASAESSSFIRIESKVQKHCEYLGPVVTHSDAQKTTTHVFDGVREITLFMTLSKPYRIPKRDGRPCCQLDATAQQKRSDLFESFEILSLGEMSGRIEWCKSAGPPDSGIGAMIQQRRDL